MLAGIVILAGALGYLISVHQPPKSAELPFIIVMSIGVTVGMAGVSGTLFRLGRENAANAAHRQARIQQLQTKADEQPEKSKYAWEVAREKLEDYFDKNIAQVKAVFIVAIVVMSIGFLFIGWGLCLAILNPDRVKVALIASASGIITQFIGLTFMVIYKSTMTQAGNYMTVLENINRVGMAVGILDSMKDDAGELKDATRVDIIRLLLATPSSQITFKPRTRKGIKTSPDKSATD
jgi:putative ubiquitin-RnfH superfamily antitoxin RatB of RatAB toxin-antitoxin module